MKNRLKEIRLAKGFTLEELAERAGVGKSTIGNFENGRTDASEEFLKKVSEALETPVSEILESPRNASPARTVQEESGAYGDREADVLRIIRGGPAEAAKKMTDEELLARIKEHTQQAESGPEYMRGAHAEIIAALSLELNNRSKPKQEGPNRTGD